MTGQQALRAVGFALSCGVAAQLVAREHGMADGAYLGMPVTLVVLSLIAIIWRLGGE